MKRKVNINVGISSSAIEFLKKNALKTIMSEGGRESSCPVKELDRRFGDLNDIRLHRYPLNNGSFAKEFVQCRVKAEEGAIIVFIGLETEGERFLWKNSSINDMLMCRNMS